MECPPTRIGSHALRRCLPLCAPRQDGSVPAPGTMPIQRLQTVSERIRAETQDRPPRGVRHDDDDGDIGTFASDDAIGFDPFPMLAVMQATEANYAVFGQVAGILHGSSEPTGDLDILWDGSPDAVDRLASELGGAGVVLRDEAFIVVEKADYRRALAGAKVYFEGLGTAGDLCTPRLRWGALDVASFLTRKVWASAGELAVPYVCLDDLLTMRRAVPGGKHARRLRELESLASSPSS